jgi:hypothetical protein
MQNRSLRSQPPNPPPHIRLLPPPNPSPERSSIGVSAPQSRGASFGLALQALTQEDALPALGLMANAAGQASAVPSYVAYGVTTEIVRGFVRKRL